jgi:hypothetical protein
MVTREINTFATRQGETQRKRPRTLHKAGEAMAAIINISDELREHYETVLKTRDAVLEEPTSSGSEMAAVLRVTTDLIKELARIQTAVYSAESLSVIQQAIINALDEADMTTKMRVLEALERHLENINE